MRIPGMSGTCVLFRCTGEVANYFCDVMFRLGSLSTGIWYLIKWYAFCSLDTFLHNTRVSNRVPTALLAFRTYCMFLSVFLDMLLVLLRSLTLSARNLPIMINLLKKPALVPICPPLPHFCKTRLNSALASTPWFPVYFFPAVLCFSHLSRAKSLHI